MAKINILDKNVSELIAAGEVIERPASIIKELLENSIDALATAITVEIKNGGISYIRITDNGIGIDKQDMPIAFLRHATSKLKTEQDLDNICTLGFRGEALASISAVSKLQMMSKTKDDIAGNKISLIAGEIESFEDYGCPQGTTIIVKDLFYNVPARLKFLKKATSEANAIENIVEKIAISHPKISFKLIKDGKVVLHTSGDGKLISTIYSVLGREFAKSLLEVNYEHKGIKVYGYVTKPSFSRGNRTLQHFFVNDRYVKSRTCMLSLEESYKNSIMVSKFPGCVLMLKIDVSQVDVNVHPSKIEIRFSKEQDVFEAVYFSVKTALSKEDILQAEKQVKDDTITKKIFSSEKLNHNQINLQTQNIDTSNAIKTQNHSVHIDEYKHIINKNNSLTTFRKEPPKIQIFNNKKSIKDEIFFEQAPKIINEDTKILSDNNNIFNENTITGFNFINKDTLKKQEKEEIKNEDNIYDEDINIKMIGELFKTYVLFEVQDTFIMLDKHACHERIIFEQLRKDIQLTESQVMLTPIPILLSPEERGIIENNIYTFNRFGFDFDFDTQKEYYIKSAPVMLQKYNLCDIVLDIVDNIVKNKIDIRPEKFEDILHMIACKKAIKANQDNNIIELTKLAKQVYFDKNIRHCPHGRPVGVIMTKYDIERKFGRV